MSRFSSGGGALRPSRFASFLSAAVVASLVPTSYSGLTSRLSMNRSRSTFRKKIRFPIFTYGISRPPIIRLSFVLPIRRYTRVSLKVRRSGVITSNLPDFPWKKQKESLDFQDREGYKGYKRAITGNNSDEPRKNPAPPLEVP